VFRRGRTSFCVEHCPVPTRSQTTVAPSRFQISNNGFGVAAVHAELRHGQPQSIPIRPDAGGQQFDHVGVGGRRVPPIRGALIGQSESALAGIYGTDPPAASVSGLGFRCRRWECGTVRTRPRLRPNTFPSTSGAEPAFSRAHCSAACRSRRYYSDRSGITPYENITKTMAAQPEKKGTRGNADWNNTDLNRLDRTGIDCHLLRVCGSRQYYSIRSILYATSCEASRSTVLIQFFHHGATETPRNTTTWAQPLFLQVQVFLRDSVTPW